MNELPQTNSVLVVPRVRIQNANAISSPMTWGFPAITAFIGLMHALERKLANDAPIAFHGVGVICHSFDPQVTDGGYTRAFRLTRNPVGKDGKTSAIVEEGRVHLEISLVFGVSLLSPEAGEGGGGNTTGQDVAQMVADALAGMRIAGGSVIPNRRDHEVWQRKPRWIELGEAESDRAAQMRRLRRQLLPGFALVLRQDILDSRLATMQADQPEATPLDAWLDLSRLYIHPPAETESELDSNTGSVTWEIRRPPGWLVPIPVGYQALSDCYSPGIILAARDDAVPFRFVESLYSIGEWVSPHRLKDIQELLWVSDADPDSGIYRCLNSYGERRQSGYSN